MQQKKSFLHISSIMLYILTIYFSYKSPTFLLAGFIIFFLITSLKMLWKMAIFMVIIGGLVAIIPILSPLVFLLMIFLFIKRIDFVKRNWLPIKAGMLIYGSSLPLYLRWKLETQLGATMIEQIIVAAIGGIILHNQLVKMYNHGYSTQTALGIMGSVPLVLISFIMPFLKLHLFNDGGIDVSHFDASHSVDGHMQQFDVIHTDNTSISSNATSSTYDSEPILNTDLGDHSNAPVWKDSYSLQHLHLQNKVDQYIKYAHNQVDPHAFQTQGPIDIGGGII